MKASAVVLSYTAVADILEQADWYRQQSDSRLAQRWEKSVTSTLLRIVENPLAGTLCRFKSKELSDVRRLPVDGFRKHLIFYRFKTKRLLLLRVVHGARDLESLF